MVKSLVGSSVLYRLYSCPMSNKKAVRFILDNVQLHLYPNRELLSFFVMTFIYSNRLYEFDGSDGLFVYATQYIP